LKNLGGGKGGVEWTEFTKTEFSPNFHKIEGFLATNNFSEIPLGHRIKVELFLWNSDRFYDKKGESKILAGIFAVPKKIAKMSEWWEK
jgi:hypothetical protein